MKTLLATFAFCLSLFAFSSCSTDTANEATNRRHRVENQLALEAGRILGKVALSTLANVATAELSGGNVDWGHSASSAVWSNATSIVDSASIERVINAASDHQIPAVASEAAKQFDAALANGVSPAKAAFAIGDAISAVSLTMPSPGQP